MLKLTCSMKQRNEKENLAQGHCKISTNFLRALTSVIVRSIATGIKACIVSP